MTDVENIILLHVACDKPVTVSDVILRKGNRFYRCNHCRRYGIAYRRKIEELNIYP